MSRREQEFHQEGFGPAWVRFRCNVAAITASGGEPWVRSIKSAAWRDLSHSFVNIHVEFVREIVGNRPKWLPKVLGKGVVAAEVAFFVGLIVWPILVVV